MNLELIVTSGIAVAAISAIFAGVVQFTRLQTIVSRFLAQDDKMHLELNTRLSVMSERLRSLELSVTRLEEKTTK